MRSEWNDPRISAAAATRLYVLLLYLCRNPKAPSLRRFKSDQGEIWHECSARKFASTDESHF